MARYDEPDRVDRLLEEYAARRINRRQFFQRSAVFGVSLAAAGALLAACGGSGEGDATTAAADTGGGGADTAAGTTAEATGEPVVGGTLIEGYDRDFAKNDPVLTTWDDPALVAIYEFPLVRDADGAYQPALFDSWEVSDDLLTWTFKLPAGRMFQIGAPLDAQMVADNFNAFRTMAPRSPRTRTGRENSIFWPTVANATASDPTTVVVTMKAPFTAFPETLATENSMTVNLARARSSASTGRRTAPRCRRHRPVHVRPASSRAPRSS